MKREDYIEIATLLNLAYATEAHILSVSYDLKQAQVHRRFCVLKPQDRRQADHSLVVNLKQNKIALTETAIEEKIEITAESFAETLKFIKEKTDKFHANKQGLVYLQMLSNERVLAGDTTSSPMAGCEIA